MKVFEKVRRQFSFLSMLIFIGLRMERACMFSYRKITCRQIKDSAYQRMSMISLHQYINSGLSTRKSDVHI